MAKEAEASGEAPSAPAKSPSAAVEELPKAIVRRVVKEKLSQLFSPSASSPRQKSKGKSVEKGGEGEDVTVQKDALTALAESARIFIHYLSAAANDICKESRRQTINADDVLKAIEEIEFPEFIEPLRVSLEAYRRNTMAKKSGAKSKATEAEKKRKLEEEEPAPAEEDGEDGPEGDNKEEEEDDAMTNE